MLGSVSGAIISCDVTGLGGGLGGHVARLPGSQDSARLWPVGLPRARESPSPGVGAASQAEPVRFLYFMLLAAWSPSVN